MKVLVIDDSESMVKIIQGFFKRMGIDNVDVAPAGDIGLMKLQTDKEIKLVISDWNMPFMNGLEFLEKARDVRDDVYMIFITANEDKRLIMQALNAGAKDYFIKPLDFQSFRVKMTKTINTIQPGFLPTEDEEKQEVDWRKDPNESAGGEGGEDPPPEVDG